MRNLYNNNNHDKQLALLVVLALFRLGSGPRILTLTLVLMNNTLAKINGQGGGVLELFYGVFLKIIKKSLAIKN